MSTPRYLQEDQTHPQKWCAMHVSYIHRLYLVPLNVYIVSSTSHGWTAKEIGRHCLKIPGKLLDVSILLDKKKFRAYENKDGALKGFRQLQEDGLGVLEPRRGRGSKVRNISIHSLLFLFHPFFTDLPISKAFTFESVYFWTRRMRKKSLNLLESWWNMTSLCLNTWTMSMILTLLGKKCICTYMVAC